MSGSNGHASILNRLPNGEPIWGVRTSALSPADRLESARTENALVLERIRGERLARLESRERKRRELSESLSIDWVTPYAELLDLTRRSGDPTFTGPATYWQRRQGRNWPIFQTEQELAILRAPARLLLATVSYAQGLVEGLTSYVLGPGCTYRVAKSDDHDDLPDEVVDAAQDVIDRTLERNQWYGGELPGIEEECFGRSIEDGEFILLHYPCEDGWTDYRVAEPEQLTQPPGEDFREWGFGIKTPPDDTQKPERYYLQHGESPGDGEEYDPEHVTHFRRNVRRSMKRGLTDFCFDSYDALYSASRLRANLGEAAAEQAAIVGIRQWENGTADDVQAFNDSDADFTQSVPLTGGQENVKLHKKGGWEDVPKGFGYIPGPIAQSQPIHLQVLDNLLRSAGQKWQAPPWLMSGDLNAMNYATSLTAESPFVKTVLRRQRGYCEAFRRPVWFALEHYCRTRGLRDRSGKVWDWETIKHRLKLQVTAPSPETRDKLQEAQRAQTEITLGVQSRQAYMQEQGRDVDQIEADNQAYQDKFGQGGQQLPMPGDGGGTPPGMESLLESIEVELLEDDAPPGKVWKTITYNRGGKTVSQKRLVNAPTAAKVKAPKAPDEEKVKAKQVKVDAAAKVKAEKTAAKDAAKAAKVKARDEAIAAKAAASKAAADAKVKAKADAVAIVNKVAAGHPVTAEDLTALSSHLSSLTTSEITAIQKAFGGGGGRAKPEKVAKIVAWASAGPPTPIANHGERDAAATKPKPAAKPKAAPRVKATGSPVLDSLAAAKATATPRVQEAIEAVLHNATDGKGKAHDDPKRLARAFTSQWQELAAKGADPDELKPITAAMEGHGMEPIGTHGEPVRFDGSAHEGPAGSFTGDQHQVSAPGWRLGQYVVSKAKTAPAAAAKEKPSESPHLDELHKVASDLAARQDAAGAAPKGHPSIAQFRQDAADATDQFRKLSPADRKALIHRLTGHTARNGDEAMQRFRLHVQGAFDNIRSQDA